MKPSQKLMEQPPYFVKGRAYRVKFHDRPYSVLVHVLEIIDEDQVVYKYFGKYRQWWHYGILHCKSLKVNFDLNQSR